MKQSKYPFNVIGKKALRKLKKELPRGCTTTIRARLMKKFPEMNPFTIQYINMVLDPDDSRMNTIIIEEAILLRDELRSANNDLEARIFQS